MKYDFLLGDQPIRLLKPVKVRPLLSSLPFLTLVLDVDLLYSSVGGSDDDLDKLSRLCLAFDLCERRVRRNLAKLRKA